MGINLEIWLRFTSIGQDELFHIKTHNQISEVNLHILLQLLQSYLVKYIFFKFTYHAYTIDLSYTHTADILYILLFISQELIHFL